MDNVFYIALGANLPSRAGPPEATLAAALFRLSELGLGLRSVSQFWRTPAMPAGSGPDYVNACCIGHCKMQGAELLGLLHQVEAEFGRVREGRWQSRGIDLDLLAMGELILPDRETFARWQGLDRDAQQRETPGDLILPHPRIQDRGFVLIPLADIAPLWRHPVTGKTVREMLAALPEDEKAAISPLSMPVFAQ